VGTFAPGCEAETAQLAVERAAKAVELWLELGPEAVQKVMASVNAPDFRQVTAKGPPTAALPGPTDSVLTPPAEPAKLAAPAVEAEKPEAAAAAVEA